MKKYILLLLVACLAVSVVAEFRTWTDKNGNIIEAELVRKEGSSIILRDR